ncbi:MAG: YkgJ family cysteine cluster protein [Deltaproteobacteria bacterium]|nr:YkgJ family cysteine cluster protein [Deltaproteobacteria bacterium]
MKALVIADGSKPLSKAEKLSIRRGLPISLGPSVCGRCVAAGGGCCTSEPGIFGPPLTRADEERIAAATGLTPRKFVHVRSVDAEEQRAWEEDVPSAKGIVVRGKVRSLARPDGRCLLLTERGCSLPLDARPLQCRLFPFVVRGRSLTVQPAGECLAVREADGISSLARQLRTSAQELVQLDGQLQEELGQRTPKA